MSLLFIMYFINQVDEQPVTFTIGTLKNSEELKFVHQIFRNQSQMKPAAYKLAIRL